MKNGFCPVCEKENAQRLAVIRITDKGHFYICWNCRIKSSRKNARFETANQKGQTTMGDHYGDKERV